MKKFIAILSFAVYSCNPVTHKDYSAANGSIDPILKQHMVDSMVSGVLKNAYLKDTIGIGNAPVRVISARPAKKDYSSYKDISLTYKNVSGKTISAIKFKWYGLNAFGDPADMGSLSDGFGAGFTDDKLRNGKTETNTWSILSRDLKKVTKAWAYEVVFEDGTKWKAGNDK